MGDKLSKSEIKQIEKKYGKIPQVYLHQPLPPNFNTQMFLQSNQSNPFMALNNHGSQYVPPNNPHMNHFPQNHQNPAPFLVGVFNGEQNKMNSSNPNLNLPFNNDSLNAPYARKKSIPSMATPHGHPLDRYPSTNSLQNFDENNRMMSNNYHPYQDNLQYNHNTIPHMVNNHLAPNYPTNNMIQANGSNYNIPNAYTSMAGMAERKFIGERRPSLAYLENNDNLNGELIYEEIVVYDKDKRMKNDDYDYLSRSRSRHNFENSETRSRHGSTTSTHSNRRIEDFSDDFDSRLVIRSQEPRSRHGSTTSTRSRREEYLDDYDSRSVTRGRETRSRHGSTTSTSSRHRKNDYSDDEDDQEPRVIYRNVASNAVKVLPNSKENSSSNYIIEKTSSRSQLPMKTNEMKEIRPNINSSTNSLTQKQKTEEYFYFRPGTD